VPLHPDALLRRAAEAKRGSRRVALPTSFDPEDERDWRELVIDLTALANSGGGVAVVDADVDGTDVARRVERETGAPFRPLDVQPVSRNGALMTAIVVEAAEDTPLLVDQQAYFRHGAKSKPATAADLRTFLERRLDVVRRQWLRSIREVLVAPRGAHVAVVHTDETDEHGVPTLIRLSSDPNAPIYGKLDPDRTHPYRQTEAIAEANRRLPEGVELNPYDVLSVRRVHDISEETRPDFTHVPKFGSPQYSEAFVDWLVDQYERDPKFFTRAKAQYTGMVRRRRRSG
jgi:EC042_2821-lke REase